MFATGAVLAETASSAPPASSSGAEQRRPTREVRLGLARIEIVML